MSSHSLAAALNPSSIAIVGASDNPNKVGGRPLMYLSKFGFKGRIYPINPARDRVQGVPSFPSLAALPEAPDLAIVATPGDSVMGAIEDCANRGVRAAIVMSSGYGETSDAESIAAEQKMVATARAAGMRLIGPNCQGLANFGTGAVASFSTMFIETTPADGPVGIISQSGMMSVVPYGLLRQRGIGVRHSHATGNEADVTLSEFALAVLHDPAVELLLLYIESLRNADVLAEAAALARERNVPIIAVKTGRTTRGQAAARSHTAALANDDRVVDAFFHRHGIWRVDDIHEQVNAAELYLKGWRPKNRTLVVVSNSGASCVMAADTAQGVGLELAALSDTTVKTLASHLPSFATAINPIDITAALLTDSTLFGRMLSVLAEQSDADQYLLALPVVGTGYDVPLFARDAATFMANTGKAVVLAAPQESVAAEFRATGVPVFSNQTDAMRALGQVARHATLMRAPIRHASSARTVEVPAGEAPFLDEAESLELLAAHGLPAVAHRVCRSTSEVAAAWRDLGGVVAIKACASAIPHKSEHQLVVLNVTTEERAVAAFNDLMQKLADLGVDGGVIVARMARGFEAMIGARIDPALGPVLLVGSGGKYVEVFHDVAVLMPPVTAGDVRDALLGLRIAPFFAGVRGEAPLDLDALCEAAVRLGDIIAGSAGQIASIDLNPVIVGAKGEGVVIVDALVERGQARLVTA